MDSGISKRHIKIGFADFWPNLDPENNYFTRLLRTRYEVEITARPDFLLYSVFGRAHREHDCVRIFYTGENVRPDFTQCNYAFTFDVGIEDPRHYRLPLCWLGKNDELVKSNVDAERILREKTGFCAFVVSNPKGKLRNRFFRALSKYKPVSSGGKLFNNIGGRVKDKQAFLSRHKFTIAFENESYPGYCTEKIVDAMRAWSVPIYWGNPLVHQDYNTKSFCSYHDAESIEALVDRVVELDRNEELYRECLRQPWLPNNQIPPAARPETILDQFERIFTAVEHPQRQTWREGVFSRLRTYCAARRW